ncbi:hypothetical protein FCV43_08970 [Vibrio genomosp. F6]|uniref:hypothetical protein n=1 Tax=Vibrio genomosp. F6 TaxID=723172 RepID=UPI0010BD9F48|nr:hypothetical protein [Vibrio genomosp. F6]TKF21950.1 hypothetical protein FCV43_08970 [Vibrio genomosp. F6]
MARPTNKKAALKKRCNELENNIKQSMTFRKEHELSNSASKKLTGFNYHAKALELDTAQTRGHAVNYVYDAIADVRVNAYDFIDDAFCELHGLPLLDRFDELTDAQALFISLVVPELYPDIDDVVETNSNVVELLMPALARDKLTKARDGISLDNFDDVELLLEEVGQIAEMIIVVHQYLNPAPYKAVVANKKQHKEKISNVRSELVKRTVVYKASQDFQSVVTKYALNVKSLLESKAMPSGPEDIISACVKGVSSSIDNIDPGAYRSIRKSERDFVIELSKLASDFEDCCTLEVDDESPTDLYDFSLEMISINLPKLRRHLKQIDLTERKVKTL